MTANSLIADLSERKVIIAEASQNDLPLMQYLLNHKIEIAIKNINFVIDSGVFGRFLTERKIEQLPPDYEIQDHTDPDPKSCSIQKQNSGMIMTPLSGGCADEKVTIHRRADCLCPEAG